MDRRLAGMPSDSSFEAAVGAEGIAPPANMRVGSSPLALEGEGAGGVGVAAGHVVQHQPLQDFAMVFVLRQGHLRMVVPRGLVWSARCGSPCRGSSPRTRRRRRPFACRATGPAACGRRRPGVRRGSARASTVARARDRRWRWSSLQHARGFAQLLQLARQARLGAGALL